MLKCDNTNPNRFDITLAPTATDDDEPAVPLK